MQERAQPARKKSQTHTAKPQPKPQPKSEVLTAARMQERRIERARKYGEYCANASRELDDFQRTQDLISLRKAASTLEKGYLLVLQDEDFWAELERFPNSIETEDQKVAIEEELKDFDRFLAHEAGVLRKVSGLPSQEVGKILDAVNAAIYDRNRALRMVRSRVDMDAIANLKDRLKDMRESLQTVQEEITATLDSNEPHPIENPSRYRWVKKVSTALQVLCGVAVASVNMVDTSQSPAPSIIGGVQTIIQQLVSEDVWKEVSGKILDVGTTAVEKGRGIFRKYFQ